MGPYTLASKRGQHKSKDSPPPMPRLVRWSTPLELMDARNIPAATNSFAAGLMGFVGFLRLVNKAFFASSWHLRTCSEIFMVWALATQAVYVVKLILAPRSCREDFLSAPTNASLCAFPITICSAMCNLLAMGWISQRSAAWGIGLGYGIFVLNTPWFISQVWGRAAPDTYFLIGTVGLCILAGCAPAHSFPNWLIALSMWGGLAAAALLLPRVTRRVLRDVSASAGPSGVLLQLTPSWLCSSWYAGLPAEGSHPAAFGSERLTALMGPLLFALHVGWVLLSAYCIWQRRKAMRESWFSPGFAGWTGTTEASASAAVYFYMQYPNSEFCVWWAAVMSCIAVVTVPLFNFMYFRSLEDWLQYQQMSAFVQDHQAGLVRFQAHQSQRKREGPRVNKRDSSGRVKIQMD